MDTYKVIRKFDLGGKSMVIVRLKGECHVMGLWEWKSLLRKRNSSRQKLIEL